MAVSTLSVSVILFIILRVNGQNEAWVGQLRLPLAAKQRTAE